MKHEITCPICGKKFNNPVEAVRVRQPGVLTIVPRGVTDRKALVEFECPDPDCSAHFQIEWQVVPI